MGTASETVHGWKGLLYGKDPQPAFSERATLDEPRELLNLVHNEHGHLWLPPALVDGDLLHTFPSGTRVRHIANVATANVGTALIVQVDSAVFIFNTSAADVEASKETLVADTGSGDTVWINATEVAVYIGTQTKTWKVTGLQGSRAISDITSSTQQGFHSYTYRGRRFVMQRTGATGIVKFSEINQPQTFEADSEFTVGGDQTGGSWQDHPGSVVAFHEVEDVLLIFCTNSIWALTGSSPDNFRLRRTNSDVGCWSRDSIVRTSEGILFMGGTPRGEMGVYLFTGNQSLSVSDEISGFFRDWSTADGSFEDASRLFSATRWKDRYILAADTVDGDREVYVYNLRSRTWSTLDGFTSGVTVAVGRNDNTATGGLDRLTVASGLSLYVTASPLVRAPSSPEGRVLTGWHDQQRPAGLLRFLAAKVGAWSPTAAGTLDARFNVPGLNGSWVGALLADFHEHHVLPVAARGKAIEVDLRVTGAGEAIIESLEVVMSRKGEKISRG